MYTYGHRYNTLEYHSKMFNLWKKFAKQVSSYSKRMHLVFWKLKIPDVLQFMTKSWHFCPKQPISYFE